MIFVALIVTQLDSRRHVYIWAAYSKTIRKKERKFSPLLWVLEQTFVCLLFLSTLGNSTKFSRISVDIIKKKDAFSEKWLIANHWQRFVWFWVFVETSLTIYFDVTCRPCRCARALNVPWYVPIWLTNTWPTKMIVKTFLLFFILEHFAFIWSILCQK